MQRNEVTVLLVDDDEIDVMGVQRAFQKARIMNPVVTAADGMDALEKLRNGSVKKPYLILLDINMPRMNGLEFLDEIRRDSSLMDSIVFVLTTSNAEKDKCMAYKHNIAAYIIKENVGQDFLNALSLIESYWKIVEFPMKWSNACS